MHHFRLLSIAHFLSAQFALYCPPLSAQEGQAIPFGKVLEEIRIEGARFTDLDIITRELYSKVGQPYLEHNAARDFNQLDKLDIFSQIIFNPVENDDGVILEIKLKEIYPYLPFLAYEVTDENGLSIGLGLQSVSLGGRDIFLTGLARFGGASSISLFLENPWFAGNHLSYTFRFDKRDRVNELDKFNEAATEASLVLGSYLGENGRIGMLLGFESIGSDSVRKTLSSNNRDNVASIGFFLGYDSRDLWSDPHRGGWAQADVSRFGVLGTDSDFWRANFDVRRYVPIANRHTLAFFSLATFTSGVLGEDFATWQDFSIGGTNSVRGWDIDARRGKNQYLGTAEYRYTLVKPRVLTFPFGLAFDIGLQLALFGDVGTAWYASEEFDDNFIGGYGFGLRFLLPFVNQFRFDFGFGESGKSFKVHIGAFTKAVAQRFRIR